MKVANLAIHARALVTCNEKEIEILKMPDAVIENLEMDDSFRNYDKYVYLFSGFDGDDAYNVRMTTTSQYPMMRSPRKCAPTC